MQRPALSSLVLLSEPAAWYLRSSPEERAEVLKQGFRRPVVAYVQSYTPSCGEFIVNVCHLDKRSVVVTVSCLQ